MILPCLLGIPSCFFTLSLSGNELLVLSRIFVKFQQIYFSADKITLMSRLYIKFVEMLL